MADRKFTVQVWCPKCGYVIEEPVTFGGPVVERVTCVRCKTVYRAMLNDEKGPVLEPV